MDTLASRDGRAGPPKTRLDRLFRDHSREVQREPYATEVAAAMAKLGEPVTDTYLRVLRYGTRPFNPSEGKRRALATALGGRAEDLPSGDEGRVALDRLWRATLVTERKEPSNREVAEWMRQRHGVTVTTRYIQQLRDGVATNPSAVIANALAAYFNVSVDYLLKGIATTPPRSNDSAEPPTSHDGRMVRTAHETTPTEAGNDEDDVRLMAMRLFGVSPQGRAFIASVIDDVRRSENLDPS